MMLYNRAKFSKKTALTMCAKPNKFDYNAYRHILENFKMFTKI